MKMKRSLIVVFLCLLLSPVVTMAADVNEIVLYQTTGATAQYRSSTSELTWSSGYSGYLVTLDGGFASFDDIDISCNFDLYDDSSSGGQASAEFTLDGTWRVDFYDTVWSSSPVITLVGTLNSGRFNGRYLESETAGGDAVDGKAWVEIDDEHEDYFIDVAWVAANAGLPSGVSCGDLIFGLQSGATLDATGFGDYDTDDYDSTNGLTITLWGDQSIVIPEPTTIALLGLGTLLLKRRRA
jgi:hypothetical protein